MRCWIRRSIGCFIEIISIIRKRGMRYCHRIPRDPQEHLTGRPDLFNIVKATQISEGLGKELNRLMVQLFSVRDVHYSWPLPFIWNLIGKNMAIVDSEWLLRPLQVSNLFGLIGFCSSCLGFYLLLIVVLFC